MFVALTLALACGGKVKPRESVVGAAERAAVWGVEAASGAIYTGPARTTAPILPAMAFGMTWDLDFAFGADDDTISRIELGRTAGPDGRPRWFVVETDVDGEQTLLVEASTVDLVFPEAPIRRFATTIDVEDASDDTELRVTATWKNRAGKPVVATFVSGHPKPMKHRNAVVEGQARNSALVAVDVAAKTSAFSASVDVDGTNLRAMRLAGFVPMQFAMTQATGGLATGSWSQRPGSVALSEAATLTWIPAEAPTGAAPAPAPAPAPVGDPVASPAPVAAPAPAPVSAATTAPEVVAPPPPPPPPASSFETTHLLTSGHRVVQPWSVTPTASGLVATATSAERTLVYTFRGNEETVELSSISSTPTGTTIPSVSVEFAPALPDLRRPFEGTATARYVIDVNGSRGHATGRVESRWDGDAVSLSFLPDAPSWTVDRPLVSTIRIAADGSVESSTKLAR